jgi:menaquinone-9 beta-reductase
VKERYFFRRGAGSGWTLVGDAGHHKEFVIGDGITEALLQARSLAAAITQGTDAALIRWWRARDVEALPYFFLGQSEGALRPPSQLQQVVFARAAKAPALRARLAATIEHRLSPTETFPARDVLWWALAAALRGSPGVLPQFIARGKHESAIDRELRLRRRLLAEAEAEEEHAKPPDMSLGSGVLPRAAEFKKPRS